MFGLDTAPTASPARLAVSALGVAFLHPMIGARVSQAIGEMLPTNTPGFVADGISFAIVLLEAAAVSMLYTRFVAK